MARGSQCNGCYKNIWYHNKAYLYCSLCKTVYTKEPGTMMKVEDPEIIKAVLTLAGTAL